ncbi:MAG: AMP-binding protein [Candidatus Bipolaricaulota bacterium]|nr:AMP-binding protein [Candidatus Bipolaricaulota bacterium]
MYPTLNELFNKAVAAHGEKIALRMLIPKERKHGREIQLVLNEISYTRLGEMAGRLATALDELGVKKGDKVALISKPRAAWATAFFAILKCGAAVLPLDPELQEGEIERILVEAEAKGAIVSGLKVADLQTVKSNKLSDLILISMDRPKSDDVHFLDQLLLGKKEFSEVDISSDDMAVLMYTSGTTGNAKGAMLLHRNISSNAISGVKVADISEKDTFLTIVPWYHIYGLTISLLVPLFAGSTATYAPVDRNLTTVMTKARPTVLLGVPKLYNVLYSKVMTSIEGSLLKKTIYKLSPTLMGKLVRKKLFGKSFRYFTSGGAPFSREVANGFRKMGIGVMEGYGLTETSPVLAMCERFTTEPGMVAYENVELRIDKPDASGIGEIVARGPNIMAGYYKNEAATAEVIDEEGWFHTGDLGRMEGDRVILSGRAKNVIVLETGKNVYPEEVEWELATVTGIEELLVYEADRQGTPTVAVKIYPKWADLKEKGITTPEQAIDYMWEEIKVHNENIAPFKRIKYRDAITLVDEPFEKSVKMDIKRYKYSKV